MESKKPTKAEAKKKLKAQNFPLLNFNHIQRFSVVVITTLIVVLSLVGLGYYLDNKLDTKPWLLVTGLILSFPIAQIVVYRRMKHYMKKEFKRLGVKEKESK